MIWRDETLAEHLRKINNRPQPKSVGLHEIAERPLEMAETDETHFDFKVRDSVTGKIGMPSVLLICDQRTGMPLGRNVGIGAANAERARLMMLNAIEPKSPIKFVGGMQFVSPARGLMNAVTGDLGAIFTADDFVLRLADLGIETASTPPRMPELKGRIGVSTASSRAGCACGGVAHRLKAVRAGRRETRSMGPMRWS